MEKIGLRDRVADCCGFSREGTAILKGLAILVMIAHHLYGMYGVQVDDALRYSEIVRDFAIYGKVCVLLFFFVTGYGYCWGCEAEKNGKPWLLSVWKRLKSFYLLFLVMLAITTLLLGCFGHLQASPLTEYAGSWKGFLFCATGLVDVYADYWYMAVFLCGAVVIYPLLRWGRQRGAVTECLVFVALSAVCLGVPANWEMTLKMLYHVSMGSLPTVFLQWKALGSKHCLGWGDFCWGGLVQRCIPAEIYCRGYC